MSTHFDAVVVGAGQAGPSLAARLRGAGMTVAIVERHLFGGTCVNTGCRPTKAMVASAHAAHMAREAARWGVIVDGSVSMDMVRVRERKNAVILPSRNGGQTWLRDLGCVIYHEHASFLSPTELSVGDEIISAERIFLNVGGRAVVPDWPGVDDVPLFTNSSLIEYDGIPEHLVVIGGSYVGLEFAQIYRRFGSQVTVVHRGPRLVEREDPDASAIIQEVLEREGITFRLNASCINLARHDEGVAVGVDCTDGAPEVVGSHVLVAVGRRPNTDDLGLENAGWPPTPAGTSRSTTSCARAHRGSGRSVTATGVAPSHIPRTTTSRSSLRTFWTTIRDASPIGCPVTRCTPIRPWDEWA